MAEVEARWPLRSLLYIPANKLDWVRKADRSGPHGVVLDLEDSVVKSEKAAARVAAREGIEILSKFGIEPFVRINSADEGGTDDVETVVVPGLAGIVLPKARSAADVRWLDLRLAYAEGAAKLPLGSIDILPTPETIDGMLDMRAIAGSSERVRGMIGLVGGAISGDFSRSAGFRPTDEGFEQLYFASKTVMESRGGGAQFPMATIIGSDLKNLDSARALMVRAKAIGFTGAMVIYPPHATIANEVFGCSLADIEYAQGLIEAMAKAAAGGEGATTYRGRMVDLAMVPEAEAILREARRRPSGGGRS
jgi:citrate lyase subunit beta/citryl-CoA lyase